MKIAIRADADSDLGSGHVVRMMTLADALQARGCIVHFLSRRIPSHLADAIAARGHVVARLPDGNDWRTPAAPWPELAQRRDSEATMQFANDATWIIVDHYGLDHIWERSIRGRILAVDDLGRDHDCAILLDQNFYAEPAARYKPGTAHISLVGPAYALLRPEFALARAKALRVEVPVRRILLFMGGMNDGGATLRALTAIALAGLETVAVDIVVGATHADLDEISARVAANPVWTLHVQTSDMAELMRRADMAIGAGGTATWERCALGLPAVALRLAENQRAIVLEGEREGFLVSGGDGRDITSLAAIIRNLADNALLRTTMSRIGMALTDGTGAERVAACMELTHES